MLLTARHMRRRFFLLKKLEVWPRLQCEFADALLKVRLWRQRHLLPG
jgi:hypothetical protein